MKLCSKCGETKPLDGFAKDRSASDGLQGSCRKCKSDQFRRWKKDGRLKPVRICATGMKYCNRCQTEKAIDDFARSAANSDGRQGRCRLCQSQLATDWNKANRDRCRQTDRNRYQRDRDKRLAASKRHKENNPEKYLEYSRQKYKRNPDKQLAATKAWALKNPLKAKEIRDHSNLMRRARLHEATGTHTKEERAYLLNSYLGRCAYCFSAPATDFDHVVPLARGGTNDIENLVPACEFCNASKGAKSLLQFMMYRMAG